MTKTWGPFTGNQLTILLVAAIAAFVPGTLMAVDAYQNVAIQDPVSGYKAAVDSARRLSVFDSPAFMDEQPGNFVRFFPSTDDTCENVYVVPSGRALIITSMTAFIFREPGAPDSSNAELYGQANCSGPLLGAAIGNEDFETVFQTFGSGIALPSGRTLSAKGYYNSGTAEIYGYLVPGGFVPSTANTVASPVTAAGGNPLRASR